MSKCPKCNADLKFVYYIAYSIYWYKVSVVGSGLNYHLDEETPDGDEYKCPNCGEVIATTREEIQKLLMS